MFNLHYGSCQNDFQRGCIILLSHQNIYIEPGIYQSEEDNAIRGEEPIMWENSWFLNRTIISHHCGPPP